VPHRMGGQGRNLIKKVSRRSKNYQSGEREIRLACAWSRGRGEGPMGKNINWGTGVSRLRANEIAIGAWGAGTSWGVLLENTGMNAEAEKGWENFTKRNPDC